MNRLPVLALFAGLVFAESAFPADPGPRTVYLLPMAGGLDQYLAQWLTRNHAMQVTTNPKLADTVMTDRLGEAFEQKMAEFHPKADKKSTADSSQAGDSPHNAFQSGRGSGAVFLVDAKSGQVLWSDYEKPPGDKTGANLNREAERIVKKLQAASAK